MVFQRSSGILLHPTSLPGPDGIGDLGPEAFHWIDFLEECGCKLWQILPLGPTGYGDSPYQCFSAFAGNPFLVSPFLLVEQGLLQSSDLSDRPQFPDRKVDFGEVISWKNTILDRAYQHYCEDKPAAIKKEYEQFCKAESEWLDDFALFMAIKDDQGLVAWDNWQDDLRLRDEKALTRFQSSHKSEIANQKFRQYLFFKQWESVRAYAHQKNIQIIGDIPIFVSFDSADAWAHPELFHLDVQRRPTHVAGVPPDYFSPTGQLWGNPLYHWDVHKEQGYSWWIKRIRSVLKVVDIIRLDHFRGFAGYWEIPFGSPTAETGKWQKGPGKTIFNAFKKEFPSLPIIAEDLGEITPDVFVLRDAFNLPGMKVLQFAFSTDAEEPFLPHNYIPNCVVYTGTHDNDTTLGWYQSAPEVEKDFCRRYLARSGDDIAWDLIRAGWSSTAVFSVAPLQDLLSLGTEARMNYPGKPAGNWNWRFLSGELSPFIIQRMKEMNTLYLR